MAEIRTVFSAEDHITSTLKQIEGGLGGLETSFASFSNTVKSLFGVHIIKRVATDLVMATSKFEQAEVGLKTLTGSAQKGAKLFEELRKFSNETTFSTDNVVSAAGMLMNAGVKLGNVKDTIKMLGDASLGNVGKFNEVLTIYTKILNMGRAGSIQLDQLQRRGVPVNTMLKKMGVTGVASAEQVTEAIRMMTAEGGQFFNGMDNAVDTIEGQLGFVSGLLDDIKVAFMKNSGLLDMFNTGLRYLVDILDKTATAMNEIEQHPLLKFAVQDMPLFIATNVFMNKLPKLISLFTKLGKAIKAAFTINGVVALAIGAIAVLVKRIIDTRKEFDRMINVANRGGVIYNEKTNRYILTNVTKSSLSGLDEDELTSVRQAVHNERQAIMGLYGIDTPELAAALEKKAGGGAGMTIKEMQMVNDYEASVKAAGMDYKLDLLMRDLAEVHRVDNLILQSKEELKKSDVDSDKDELTDALNANTKATKEATDVFRERFAAAAMDKFNMAFSQTLPTVNIDNPFRKAREELENEVSRSKKGRGKKAV